MRRSWPRSARTRRERAVFISSGWTKPTRWHCGRSSNGRGVPRRVDERPVSRALTGRHAADRQFTMSLWERSRARRAAILGVTALLVTGASAPAYAADEVEQVVNGGFDTTTD